MVLIPLLTWIKLRRGHESGELSVDGKIYDSLDDYNFNVESGERAAEPRQKCVWPCDYAVLEWYKFADKHHRGHDVYIAMLIFTFLACIPSWTTTYLLCKLLGYALSYWFIPIWILVDFAMLCLYYGLRFGSEVMCSAMGHVRVHSCFKKVGKICCACCAACLTHSGPCGRRISALIRKCANFLQTPEEEEGEGIESGVPTDVQVDEEVLRLEAMLKKKADAKTQKELLARKT